MSRSVASGTELGFRVPFPDDQGTAFLIEIRDRARRGDSTDEIRVAFLTLRLIAGVEKGERADDWGLNQISSEVEGLRAEALGKLELQKLLKLNAAVPTGSTEVEIAKTLSDFALRLEHEGLWALAAEVYAFLINRARPMPANEYDSLVIHPYIRLGHCHRHLNRLRFSRSCFRRAQRLAQLIRNRQFELRAVIADAKIRELLNDSAGAEKTLTAVLAVARQDHQRDVQWRALQDLGSLVGRRGDLALALRMLHESLMLCQSDADRDRILADSCLTLVRLGKVDLAREGFLVLASSAHERIVRWGSSLNLMLIAALAANRAEFERLTNVLSLENLSFEMRVVYQQTIGEGLLCFGDEERAKDHFQRARAMTSEYGLNRYMVEIEHCLIRGRQDPSGVESAGIGDIIESIDKAIQAHRSSTMDTTNA